MEPCGANDETIPVKQKALPAKICIKCNEKQAVFLFRALDSTCWECLQDLLVKKFKSAIIKGRKSKRDVEKYLVAFSGGASSSALLHLLWNSSGENARKKIRLSVVVAHIDESALGLPKEDTGETIEFLREVKRKYGYDIYTIGLEQLYTPILTPTLITENNDNTNENTTATNNNSNINNNTTDHNASRQKLVSLFAQAHSTTAKEDLQQRLRSELLQRLGSHLNVDSILLGTPADRAASLLVVNTCLGRGSAYPGAEFPGNTVTVLQPMRDFLLKEVAIYNRYSHVSSLFTPAFSTQKPVKSSIFVLSEGFVSGLQSEYPHTVHTLLKSEDKLSAPEHVAYNCAICRSPVRANAPVPHQPVTATSTSTNTTSATTSNASTCSSGNGACDCGVGAKEAKAEKETGSCSGGGCGSGGCGSGGSEDSGKIEPRFCYGCTRMMADFDPSAEERLPLPVARVSLHSMIKDYLIVDDEND